MGKQNNNKAMSREEQLQQTAEEWADYYKHAEDLCDYISIRVAYKEGAGWADEHPKNVWHEASEMPKEGEWILIQFDEDSYDALVFCDMNAVAFCTCCKKCGSIRWAYISDLLPKQFGNSKQVKGGEQ